MNTKAIQFLVGMVLCILFSSNSFVLFQITYVFEFIALAIHTFSKQYKTKNKIIYIMLYGMIFVWQTIYNNEVIFSKKNNLFTAIISRIVGSVIVLIPIMLEGIIATKSIYSMPSVQDITVFTFNELVQNINAIAKIVENGYHTFSKEHIEELVKDLPRHNAFRYINKGSLTDEYFELAYKTLEDKNIYIIISNTGSPASEIISLFTRKQYNHVSLSFDKELKTIISYNSGEKIYPPGLNMEMIKYFNKKQDASIVVYSLAATTEQKKKIIDKIKEINEQGNAYNILGLILRNSFKPNILFCSQFVYKMLKLVDLNYFEKKDGDIKPTDLVELDYGRKLNYEYKIQFNAI
ncbi:MAG: hypothetical protein LBF75_00485 [Treponema sp.]|nr:hypothetical protein [Treponema sp.]